LKSKEFNSDLESLRGFVALFVVIGHVIQYNYLDPKYTPDNLLILMPPIHLSVLIFFVLSGYVIGVSNKEKLTQDSIPSYLKKRVIRIYPIYVISLMFTLAVARTKYSFYTIVNNFTFTQIIFSKVIQENNPIWSLQYEVFYYLLFIPISYFNLKPYLVVLLSVIIGTVNFILFPHFNAPLITSYFFGFTFWSLGLLLAKSFQRKSFEINYPQFNPRYSLLISNVFLVLSLNYFNIISTVSYKVIILLFKHPIEFPSSISWYEKAISFSDLFYLPYCVMILINFSSKEFKYKKYVFCFFEILPALTFVYIATEIHSKDLSIYIIPSLYYLLSLIFYFIKCKPLNYLSYYLYKAGLWLGGISYAVYIIHFPILILFNHISFFSGTPSSLTVRFISFIVVTISISYYLEKKVQIWIKRTLVI